MTSRATRPKRSPGRIRLVITSIVLFVLGLIWVLFMAGDFRAFEVLGNSMSPTLSDGDRIIAHKVKPDDLLRGDIVVVDLPSEKEGELIKRLVALPGDTISARNGVFYVNGEPEDPPKDSPPFQKTVLIPKTTLGPDEYYVLGDNRPVSYDSEEFGPIIGKDIWGVALFRYSPWKNRKRL